MSRGHWLFESNIPEGTYGFIYEITNKESGRRYIGKKQMIRTVKRPPLKGKKNKRIKLVESDWKTYTGSSNELNADIVRLGADMFDYSILTLCNSKWELAYEETKLQFEKGVLLSDRYYNGIINCRIGKKPGNVPSKT
jgi:hypothetical protein